MGEVGVGVGVLVEEDPFSCRYFMHKNRNTKKSVDTFSSQAQSSRMFYRGGETGLSGSGGQISTCHSAAIIMCGLAELLIHAPQNADKPLRDGRHHFSPHKIQGQDGKHSYRDTKEHERLFFCVCVRPLKPVDREARSHQGGKIGIKSQAKLWFPVSVIRHFMLEENRGKMKSNELSWQK